MPDSSWLGTSKPNAYSGKEERNWGLVLHGAGLLGSPIAAFIVSLFFYLVKRDEFKSVKMEGPKVLNFHLSYFIYLIGLSALAGLLTLIFIGLLLYPLILLLWIYWLVLFFRGSIAVNKGEAFEYPFAFIKLFKEDGTGAVSVPNPKFGGSKDESKPSSSPASASTPSPAPVPAPATVSATSPEPKVESTTPTAGVNPIPASANEAPQGTPPAAAAPEYSAFGSTSTPGPASSSVSSGAQEAKPGEEELKKAGDPLAQGESTSPPSEEAQPMEEEQKKAGDPLAPDSTSSASSESDSDSEKKEGSV